MRNYICLIPKDLGFTLLVFNSNQGGRRALRDEYKGYQCRQCGKIDEFAALSSEPLLVHGFRPKYDIMESVDGVLIFSDVVWRLIEAQGILGVSSVPIENADGYKAVFFREGFRAQHNGKGMKLLNKCSECGRYQEVKGMPPFNEMHIPAHEMLFFTPWPCNESPIGRNPLLCTTTKTEGLLRKAKITGYQSF